MSSVAIGAYQATDVPVLDIHEIVAGKMAALVTRRTARDLFDAHRIIRMPGLDWAKVKVATLMISASAARFDWRKALPDAIECDLGDITNKLIACLHEGYFEAFGGPEVWIRTVTEECKAALAVLFQFTDGEKAFLQGVLEAGVFDATRLNAPESVRTAIEASPALRWKAQNVRSWKSGDVTLAPRAKRRKRGRGADDAGGGVIGKD